MAGRSNPQTPPKACERGSKTCWQFPPPKTLDHDYDTPAREIRPPIYEKAREADLTKIPANLLSLPKNKTGETKRLKSEIEIRQPKYAATDKKL